MLFTTNFDSLVQSLGWTTLATFVYRGYILNVTKCALIWTLYLKLMKFDSHIVKPIQFQVQSALH